MKAIKITIGASIVLASLAMQPVVAETIDAGSIQAALDGTYISADNISSKKALSNFYHNDHMEAQWTTAMALRIAAMVGAEPPADLISSAPYLRAQRDIRTSVQVLSLINRVKGSSYPQVLATAEDLNGFKRALSTGRENDFLESLRVGSTLITRLRNAESAYSAIVSNGGWHPVDSSNLMLADHGDDVELLKLRLNAEGYAAGEGNLFDLELLEALQLYQQAQGIEASGTLDRATQRSLNVPAWRRLQTIRANVARFETQQRLETESHIVVNIPAFKGEYFNGGKQVWQDRVIVGKTDRRTPQIASKIQRVVFNPSWYVPTTIAYRDVIPRATRDPGYWQRMGYQAYDRSGQIFNVSAKKGMKDVFDANSLRIKQAPGPSNALGQVKFLFPNKYAVYLHDTPNKNLFERDVRTFSSGCVRVNEPLKLAEILFQQQIKRGHGGLQDNSIEQVIASKKTRSINLDEPVAVSTIYLTAEPLASGKVRFHKDVYKYDTAEVAAKAKTLNPNG